MRLYNQGCKLHKMSILLHSKGKVRKSGLSSIPVRWRASPTDLTKEGRRSVMLQFPPMPTWDSLHPLIIHFPIALLLFCPVFIAISAAIRPPKGRPYIIAALLVLLLGTVSLFVAASTGEAASELAERGGAMSAVLASHEALASQTKIVFLGLST